MRGTESNTQCQVAYRGERIVVTGDDPAVHREARRLLERFQYSIKPLRIVSDSRNEIVLEPAPALQG